MLSSAAKIASDRKTIDIQAVELVCINQGKGLIEVTDYLADTLLRWPGGRLAAAVLLIVGVWPANGVSDGLRRSETLRERVPVVGRAPARTSPVFSSPSFTTPRHNGAAILSFRPSFEEPHAFRSDLQPPSSAEQGAFAGSVSGSASNVSHESDVPHKSTQSALAVNTSQGVPTNPLVANQFRGIINESFATREDFIKSGDPAKLAERKQRHEQSHTLLIELIDLGYTPSLVAGWCDDLFADQIVPGMPLDLVEAYWGDPLYIQTSGPEEILTYPFGNLYRQVILVGGQVTEVRTLSSIAES
jgi:hypothetical protein